MKRKSYLCRYGFFCAYIKKYKVGWSLLSHSFERPVSVITTNNTNVSIIIDTTKFLYKINFKLFLPKICRLKNNCYLCIVINKTKHNGKFE